MPATRSLMISALIVPYERTQYVVLKSNNEHSYRFWFSSTSNTSSRTRHHLNEMIRRCSRLDLFDELLHFARSVRNGYFYGVISEFKFGFSDSLQSANLDGAEERESKPKRNSGWTELNQPELVPQCVRFSHLFLDV